MIACLGIFQSANQVHSHFRAHAWPWVQWNRNSWRMVCAVHSAHWVVFPRGGRLVSCQSLAQTEQYLLGSDRWWWNVIRSYIPGSCFIVVENQYIFVDKYYMRINPVGSGGQHSESVDLFPVADKPGHSMRGPARVPLFSARTTMFPRPFVLVHTIGYAQ